MEASIPDLRSVPDSLPAASHVVAVCAHPDDESFGLGGLVTAYRGAGIPVDLVCFTKGEASTLGARPDLADVRSRELEAAAARLGIGRVLPYAHPDGRLDEVPLDRLIADADPAVRRADTLLVFDTHGISGHGDHRRATEVALTLADERDLTVVAWTLPIDVARTLNDEYGTTFQGHEPEQIDRWVPVDREAQVAAMRCHASQGPDKPLLRRRLALLGPIEAVRILRQRRGG